jgi:hypothetical protein
MPRTPVLCFLSVPARAHAWRGALSCSLSHCLVQRLGVLANLPLLGLVQPDEAEILLAQLAVDAAGDPQQLTVVQFVYCQVRSRE